MIKLLEMLKLIPTRDAHLWKSKNSTRLQVLQAVFGAALAAFVTLPDRILDVFPHWVLITIGGGVIITAVLTVIAANSAQQKLAAKCDDPAPAPAPETPS